MEDQKAQPKITDLNSLAKSLQEQLALMEAENQVLRKQIMNSSGNNNAQFSAQDHKEGIEALIDCVVNRVGMVHAKPVSAFTMYKCLLNWKSFQAEKTCVFDRLLQMFDSAAKSDNVGDDLAYWLANASTLLILLQTNLKASTRTGLRKHKGLSKMEEGLQASSGRHQVEAKYPALLFKLQLTTFVEAMYTTTCENLKKELTPLLSVTIQAPRAAKASIVRGHSFKNTESPRKSFSDARGSPFSNSIPESPRKSFSDARGLSFKNSMQESHWKSITDNLSDSYIMLQENGVPAILIEKMMCQIFSFINVQLFNSILLRRECCTFSNGEYLKYGLSELEAWCQKLEELQIGSAWDELEHIKQATAFLVTLQKYKVSYEELTQKICPALNAQQLYRICTQYWDDKYNSQSVSPNVLNNMRALMTDETSDVDSSDFLLDDDTSIPFTLFEISHAAEGKEFSQFSLPKEILEIPALKLPQE